MGRRRIGVTRMVGLKLRVFETRIGRDLRTEWSSSFGAEKDPGAPLS
jgi:hypothetical protein